MVQNACMLKSRAQRLQRATGGDLHLYVRHLISLACQANDRSGQMCPQLERYHSPRWPWKHFTRSTLATGVCENTQTPLHTHADTDHKPTQLSVAPRDLRYALKNTHNLRSASVVLPLPRLPQGTDVLDAS